MHGTFVPTIADKTAEFPVVRDFLWLSVPATPADATAVITQRILADVSERHGVTREEIMGDSKRAPVVAARWDAICAVAEALPGWSCSRVGRFFNRDHSSILNVLRHRGVRFPIKSDDRTRLLAMWKHGADTLHIAQVLSLPEPAVARFLARERAKVAGTQAALAQRERRAS